MRRVVLALGLILATAVMHRAVQARQSIRPEPPSRRLVVQALGRSEEPGTVDRLIGHLDDPDVFTRREAASALAQRLRHSGGDPAVSEARTALQNRLSRDKGDGDDVRTILQTLGELPYGLGEAASVERYLLSETLPTDPPHPVRQLGAVEGLEALIRLDARREMAPATLARLRQLAVRSTGPLSVAEPLLPAMQALLAANDRDSRTILTASRYRCAAGAALGCGWEFRRLAAQLMDSTDDQYADDLRRLLNDPAFQVRIEALRTVAGGLDVTHNCDPVVAALDDAMSVVAFEATRLLDRRCEDTQAIGELLERFALDLANPMKADAWMMPMHALEALARFAPDKARGLTRETAVGHSQWAVRAAAARVSGVLRDRTIGTELAADPEPKVRTDALSALRKLEAPELPRLAREELARIRPSPMSTVKLPDVGSLWVALSILKGQADISDVAALFDVVSLPNTARMARLAALDRLTELATPRADGLSPLRGELNLLERYMKEPFPADPPVAAACARIIEIITGVRPSVSQRPPASSTTPGPTGNVIMTLVGGDQVVLRLRGDEAAATAQRFLTRAGTRDDAYSDNVFHRLLPNVMMQGGSRGGSDWAATPCETARPRAAGPGRPVSQGPCVFWTDEFNPLRHERGAVALATNGPDTGIGQFFIDLVDVPAFNHEYTVFAQVICVKPAKPFVFVTDHPMDLIDRLQEGARIQRIAAPPRNFDLGSYKCVAGIQ